MRKAIVARSGVSFSSDGWEAFSVRPPGIGAPAARTRAPGPTFTSYVLAPIFPGGYPFPCGSIPPPTNREVAMKAIQWIIAAAAVACAAPVQAGVNDPEKIIYRGSGVLDNGGNDFDGLATAFHCTNFSGVNENIRFVIRTNLGALVANGAIAVPHLNTQR